MKELRLYFGAFLVGWERWSCGTLAFVVGVLGAYVPMESLRVVLGIVAVAAFFLASFFVWRDEHQRAAVLAAQLAASAPSALDVHQDQEVHSRIEKLQPPGPVETLFKIALAGEASISESGMETLRVQTDF